MTQLYRNFIALAFLLASSLLFAQRPQERLTGFSQRPMPVAQSPKAKKSQAKQVVNLPFVDDFSYDDFRPNPALWADEQVYINQTMAISPITLGVATFDGLDKHGFAYNLDRNATSGTDTLTSLFVDLSNTQDSTYLSFYYEPGGHGEPPVTQDSLLLEFWSKGDTAWQYAWGTFGQAPFDRFRQAMVKVDSQYLNNEFRFRFISYGSPAGAFDHWHLDYVKLDDNRSFDDTITQDIAYTRPHPSLLRNYEAMPWFHVENAINPSALAKNDLRLHYRRNVDPALSRPSLILGEFEIRYNGSVADMNGQPDTDLDDTHAPNTEVRFPVPDTADPGRPRLDFMANSYPDEFELISVQTYSGGSGDRSANDTIRRRQIFKNYYAYDDGTAERGYEVLNNTGNWIVQKYDVIGADSLRGVYLNFVPADFDVEDNNFTIVVLANNGGIPGQLLYESDSVYTPQFTAQNFYLPYLLDTNLAAVAVNQTVFIGIRQLGPAPLTLGFDKNSIGYTTGFYGKTNDLYQSFIPGTIMMRPFFRYVPRDLSQAEKTATELTFQLFPNPSSGSLNLILAEANPQWKDWKYELINLSGQVIASGPAAAQIDLANIKKGIYLFRLSDQNGRASVEKLILQ